MAQSMPPLHVLAQPQPFYRARYSTEVNGDLAQRFIRADHNLYGYNHPAIELPIEWINTGQRPLYIRVTHITVPSDRVRGTYIHPYHIRTENTNVILDESNNSLFFPISDDELISRHKSFQFTLHKLTHPKLVEYGPLRMLDPNENNQQHLQGLTNAKQIIEIYQLKKSQLLFSIATVQNNILLPVAYSVSAVRSQTMTATMKEKNSKADVFRFSPKSGDCRGGDEILMVIPIIDGRKTLRVRFVHPLIDQGPDIAWGFVDSKTISFHTPPCPILLTTNNPTAVIPIIGILDNKEIFRVDFVYRSLDRCLTCASNLIFTNATSPDTNKRPWLDFDETDEGKCSSLPVNRTKKLDFNQSRIRDFITAARMSSAIKSESQYSVLEKAIRQGNIHLALTSIRQTNNCLEPDNNQDETPLLLAAKLNQSILIKAILKKQPKLIEQVDRQGNNLLHLLANIPENKAEETIENVLEIIDTKTQRRILSKLNKNQQTPKQVAESHGNTMYIDLLRCKINFFEDNM